MVRTSASTAGVQAPSLLRELRSQIQCSVAKIIIIINFLKKMQILPSVPLPRTILRPPTILRMRAKSLWGLQGHSCLTSAPLSGFISFCRIRSFVNDRVLAAFLLFLSLLSSLPQLVLRTSFWLLPVA